MILYHQNIHARPSGLVALVYVCIFDQTEYFSIYPRVIHILVSNDFQTKQMKSIIVKPNKKS